MIILESRKVESIPNTNAKIAVIDVKVSHEPPDLALAMLTAAMEQMADSILKTHDPDCACPAMKVARNTKYYLAQLDEENKTLLAYNHDNKKH